MSKPRIGDVVEIGVDGKLAYALCTHSHKQFGSLIRVFSETYKVRPESLDLILDGEVGFSCFFPLGAAVKKGGLAIIGNVKVREDLRQFPVFRAHRGIVWVFSHCPPLDFALKTDAYMTLTA